MAIWYIPWLFGSFSPFWYFVARKIWQPFCCDGKSCPTLEAQECSKVKNLSEETNLLQSGARHPLQGLRMCART
jgi:hypothetical protein